MFIACCSAFMLLQRYIRDGHLPVAFARLIAMLILSVSYWAANLMSLYAIRDPIVLDWSQGAFAIQIVSVTAAALLVVMVGSDERAEAPRHFVPQILAFSLITNVMHHFGFASAVVELPLAERLPPIALSSMVGLLPVISSSPSGRNDMPSKSTRPSPIAASGKSMVSVGSSEAMSPASKCRSCSSRESSCSRMTRIS